MRKGRQRILFLQYSNPGAYPPVQNAVRVFLHQGFEVSVIGVDTEGTAALEDWGFPGLAKKILARKPSWMPTSLHYLVFLIFCVAYALRWQPHFLYASDWMSTAPAMAAGFVSRSRIVYHEHDWPAGMTDSFFRRILSIQRDWLARKALFCVLPNEERALLFRRETRSERPILIVWNCPSVLEIVARPEILDDAFIVLYQGSIVPERLPVSVVQALALLPSFVVLRIVGYAPLGNRDHQETLKRAAVESGVASRVEMVGAIPSRVAMLKESTLCHLGISFIREGSADVNMRYMFGASNKPFDYLASGIPLLLSDYSGWEILLRRGLGRICNMDDPSSVAEAVSWFLLHRDEWAGMSARGQKCISEEWNYERQFAPVLQALKST